MESPCRVLTIWYLGIPIDLDSDVNFDSMFNETGEFV